MGYEISLKDLYDKFGPTTNNCPTLNFYCGLSELTAAVIEPPGDEPCSLRIWVKGGQRLEINGGLHGGEFRIVDATKH